MIGASVGVASNSANVESGKQFEESTKRVASTLSDLIKVTGALNPGVKECENAVEEIERASAKLDAATFDAAAGKLSREGPYQQYQSDASELAKKVSQDIQNLFNAAGGTSSQLKAAALALRESVPQLASRIEDTASTAPELEIQTTLLNTTKQLADNVVKLIRNSQNINLSDKEAVAKIIALSSQSQDDVGILLGSLSSGADLPQDIDREVNSIIVALQSLGQPIAPSTSYSECREQLAASTKEAVKAITHFFNVDKRNVGQVSLAAARIGEVMTKLVTNARVSSATTKESIFYPLLFLTFFFNNFILYCILYCILIHIDDAKRGLLESTKQLGVATMYLLQDVKNMSLGQDIGQKFEKDFQAVNQATSTLLAASKKGAVGEVLIEQAIKGINQQITNLNTAGIFAQAGQLEEKPQAKQTPMSDFQNQITTDCNKLQECAKNIARIAQSAAGSDEDLGNSAVMLEKIIAQIAQLSMASASKLQDSRSQQSLLSAAKLLGISNHQFILSANDVQRIRDDSTAKQTLTTSLASVGDHVSNLGTVFLLVFSILYLFNHFIYLFSYCYE
jgi:hypothetical protein